MQRITILIVDDHLLFRETLTFMINKDARFNVIAGTGDTTHAMLLAEESNPDIILLDIHMTPVDGFKLAEQLLSVSKKFKIIAISMHVMLGYARTMLHTGALGYITKSSDMSELFVCMTEVFAGRRYLCREIMNLFANNELEKFTSGLQALSDREIGIAKMIREGLSSKDIGAQLKLATRTVEVHRFNILKKLKLKNTAALVNFANFHGL